MTNLALLGFSRVGQHERTLSSPQETSADSEDGTCSNDESTRVGVDIQRPNKYSEVKTERKGEMQGGHVQIGTNVERISHSAEEEGESRTKDIIDRSAGQFERI